MEKGQHHTPESREKMRAAKTGIRLPPQPPEVRAKHGDALRGRPKSVVHRQRLAEVNRIDGDTRNSDGRAMGYAPSHTAADKRGRVRRARLVVEEQLGRSLGADELPHHINFDRADDHPDNLMVMTRDAHTAVHHRIRRLGIEDHFTEWFSKTERELLTA